MVERIVRQVLERLKEVPEEETVTVPMLSVEGMAELSLGLAISPETRTIRQALLEGRPVRVKELESHRYRSTATPGLWRLLAASEDRLRGLGILVGETDARPEKGGHRPLITAKRAEELAQTGAPLPPNAIVTPAAADYWKQLGR
jgi:hypothetical protein